MPSTTTRGFRQQLDADPVADLALGIRNLAADVDSKVGLHQRGKATATTAAATTATVNIVFAPAFPGVPSVVATADSGAFNVAVTALTAAGATLTVRHIDAASTSTAVGVYWHASY